jgi:hypothetical protein
MGYMNTLSAAIIYNDKFMGILSIGKGRNRTLKG